MEGVGTDELAPELGIEGIGLENEGDDDVNELCEMDDVGTDVPSVTTPVEPDCGGTLGDEDPGLLSTLDWIEETIVVGTDTLDDGALLLEGEEYTLVEGATELLDGFALDAVDGVCTSVVGAELLTAEDLLVDGMIVVLRLTTFVVGLLAFGDDTLDSIEDTIVVGTDTLDDGALLLEGEEYTLVEGATELLDGFALDAVDGVCSSVVGAELLTAEDLLVDGMIVVLRLTTFVVGLLAFGDDTLDSIEDTIVVGTDTLDDGALLLEGEE